MSERHCTAPQDPGVLADYWLGQLSESEETTVEEHLLGCDECSKALRETIALAEGVRALARSGNVRMIMSDAFLARLKRDGLRTREYSPPSGGGVACTVTAQDDLLVARLAADLSTAARVDLVMYDQTGAEQRRLRDIPVSAARHEVIYNEPIDAARGFPATVLIMKLLAVDEREERVLGAYTFQHTPS